MPEVKALTIEPYCPEFKNNPESNVKVFKSLEEYLVLYSAQKQWNIFDRQWANFEADPK